MGIAALFTDTVTVKTKSGVNTAGPVYASPVTQSVFVNDREQVVRNSDGEEAVSPTTLYVPLDTLELYEPGSEVTVNGRPGHVLTADAHRHGPASAWHARITLT